MDELYVTLQDCHGYVVKVPLNQGRLRVDKIKHVFPEMQELFYVDSKDNIATMMFQRHGAIIPPTNGWNSDEGCFVVTDKEGITGDWRPMTGVCDWSTWSHDIAPNITSGPSLLRTSLSQLMDNGYRVVCGIQVENWTKYPFSNPMTTLQWGYLSCPGTTVQPATREAIVGHKCGYTATGTSGTVSWLINGSGRRLVVMWSAPFNFDFYSNRMAFGFTKKGCKIHDKNWFQTMYYNKNVGIKSGGTPRMNFKKMVCRNTCEEIIVEDDIFEMSGTMGTSHKPEIKIIVKPKHWENLARKLKVTT